MELDQRVTALNAKVRRTRLISVGSVACLLFVVAAGASSPFVDLVCKSLTIRDAEGKTTLELKDGEITAHGTEQLVSDLRELKTTTRRLREDIDTLHMSPRLVETGRLKAKTPLGNYFWFADVQLQSPLTDNAVILATALNTGHEGFLATEIQKLSDKTFRVVLKTFDGARSDQEYTVSWAVIEPPAKVASAK
jgi:hypothetical protein